MHKSQSLINHVALVLDASSSMAKHTNKLIEVADQQIRHLALRSEELSQETRVSVYVFADKVECVIFDMDVMRLPSIDELYYANGMTALIDAVVKSQHDLQTTSQLYGDHSFLTFVLTDGMENVSRHTWFDVRKNDLLKKTGWNVAFLVPDHDGQTRLNRVGVSKGNIAIWDATTERGVEDSFVTIRNATDTFMTNRAKGIQTRDVFSTGADAVNKETVSELVPTIGYKLFQVHNDGRIDDFVASKLGHYVPGSAFYQMTKRETIQPHKNVLVVDRKTKKVYGGPDARKLVGLPNETVRVRPNTNPNYDIYIQSTSLNRKLLSGTNVLVAS